MKNLAVVAGLFAAALLGAAGPASAQTRGIDLFVAPNSTRSLVATLTGGATFFNVGTVPISSAAVAGTSITVTNNGNTATTLGLAVSDQAFDLGLSTSGAPLNQHWTASVTPSVGPDTFALYAVFQTTRPANASFADAAHHVSTGTATCATTTKYKGGQSGVLVPANPADGNTVGLWLNLFTPSQVSNIKQKRFKVTVVTGGCP